MTAGETTTTPVRRRPGRPRATEPSPEYRRRLAEIVDTAALVFHQRSFDNGSLEDVADALGMAKPSLYHYVRSKGELLYLIFDRAISTALDRLRDLSAIPDPKQRVAALIAHQVRMVVEEPGMFAVFFESRVRLEDRYREAIAAKEHEYVARFRHLLEGAIAEGDLLTIETRHATHALIGMTSWSYKWFDPARDDCDQVIGSMVRMVLGPGVDVETALASATSASLKDA